MINNAGLMPQSLLERLKIDEWDRMIDVNIKGVLYGIAAALPHMKAQKSGHIINVSSVAGHKVRPGEHGLLRDQTRGPRDLGGAAAGGQALQHPHHHHLAGRGRDRTARQHHRSRQSRERMSKFYKETAIPADSFASMVVFAMSQPDDVDVNEILFRPTRQEY